MSVFTRKEPETYLDEVNRVIKLMSFKRATVVGSASLASQLYVADYDMGERVKVSSLDEWVKRFQTIIKNLYLTNDVYVGDIKCGRIVEWEVIPFDSRVENGKIVGFNLIQSKAKLVALREKGIITAEEYNESAPLLKEGVEAFYEAKDAIKFDTIRWTLNEVLSNTKKLRDGREITLKDAIQTPGLCKVDVVAWILNMRYAEFSCMYQVFVGRKEMNPVRLNIVSSLKNDMEKYVLQKKFFKYAKRLFSYAKFKNDYDLGELLTPILNSEVGRLYLMMSDIGTLLYLIENQSRLDSKRVHYEIDRFRVRLGTIYSIKTIQKYEPGLIKKLMELKKLPLKSDGFVKKLITIQEVLEKTIQKASEADLKTISVLPIPKAFRP